MKLISDLLSYGNHRAQCNYIFLQCLVAQQKRKIFLINANYDPSRENFLLRFARISLKRHNRKMAFDQSRTGAKRMKTKRTKRIQR